MQFQPEGSGIMLRKVWLVLTIAALLVALAVVAACGDDDDGGSEADKQEISDTVKQVAEAGPEQAGFFVGHVTDNFTQLIIGGTVEDCQSAPDECFSDPLTNVVVGGVTIDGDTAKTDVAATESDGADTTTGVNMVKEDGVWKVDGLFVIGDDVPDGVELVDIELVEFAFAFDAASDAVESGNFAFHVKNTGEQTHVVNIFKIPENADLQGIIQSEEEDIPGVEEIDFRFPYNPGDESDLVFDAPLEPGRYALACYISDANDPEGTPHAFKGMAAEFTVK